MKDETSILLVLIVTVLVLLYIPTIRDWIKSNPEQFGFPFKSLRSTPTAPRIAPKYTQPYCVDQHGQPVPCPVPCQYFSSSCEFDYPVPVFGPDIGAYSPNKWCPGPPVC